MAVKSITQRWVLNSLSVILAIILLAAIAFSVSIYNFYYTAVRAALTSRANISSGILLRVLDDNSVDFNAVLVWRIGQSRKKMIFLQLETAFGKLLRKSLFQQKWRMFQFSQNLGALCWRRTACLFPKYCMKNIFIKNMSDWMHAQQT